MPTRCFLPCALGAVLLLAAAPVRGDEPVLSWRFVRDALRPGEVRPRHGDWSGTFVRSPEFLVHEDVEGLFLDGQGAHVRIGDDLDALQKVLPAEAITVAAWVAVNAPQPWGGVAGLVQDNGDAEQGWLLGFQGDRFSWALASTGSDDGNGVLTYLAGGPALRPGRWHHVAGTYDGTLMRLYVDGAEVASSDAQSGSILYPVEGTFVLGAYADANEHYGLEGRLHEVAVYASALPASEIAALHGAGRALSEASSYEDTRLRFVVAPYLQYVTGDGVTVCWETTRPSTSAVEFGGRVPPTRALRGESPTTRHAVRLDGLAPGATYFYRVVSDDADAQRLTSDVFSFQTAVQEGTPFTFAVMSDTQSQPAVVRRISDRIWSHRPHFILHAGDLVSTGSDKTHWTGHFFPNTHPLLARVTMFPVLGNHEENAGHYYDYMALPDPEYHYEFVYGNAHFFMLDTNKSIGPGSAQYTWLDEALAASDATWKVAVHHHPVWTSDSDDYGDTFAGGSTRGDMNARQLATLYDAHEVDLVFSGHVHAYERSFPLRGEQVVESGGTVYVTAAGGGGSLEDFAPTKPWFSAMVRRTHHYCYVTVNGGRLVMRAYDDQGRLFDSVELRKAGEDEEAPDAEVASDGEAPSRP